MKRLLGFALSVLVVTIIWFWPPGSWLVSDCQLDGKFNDWRGRANLADPKEDRTVNQDWQALYWTTNPNEQNLYFMVERFAPADVRSSMDVRLFFDINANGNYTNKVDRYAEISYQPNKDHSGNVRVELFSVQGNLIGTYSGSWGEGYLDGGRRCEFALPMNKLQIYPAQSIRFYLTSIGQNADRLPDSNDNQWSPFPVSIKNKYSIVIASLAWLAITLFLFRHRNWVFYYVWGAVGLSCLMILLFQGSWMEYQLEHQTSMLLHSILKHFDIVTYVFDKSPGSLLVLIKLDNNWTTIDIDIENSGLLEICIIFGLIVFYPVYRWSKRIMMGLVGVVSVYIINLIRLLAVIFMIHSFGRNMSFFAHAVIGRFIFFVLIIALYWQLITKPTLEKIGENIKDA